MSNFNTISMLAEQGDADAQCKLGVMYATGDGVSQDYEKAVEWFEKAAEQGDAIAQFNLGVSYANGAGVPKDYEKAVEWFEKAAEQGVDQARENAALLRSVSNAISDGSFANANTFGIDDNGVLHSYEGPGGEVKVPPFVSCIGEEAFAFCNHVTSVILPEGVERIAKRAFFKSGIKSISLPDTLSCIEESAFSETALESIDIPDQVETIEECAFADAKHLKSVKLPKGIDVLDPHLFKGCISLAEVVLPESVKYIQGGVFKDCTSLEEIALPEGLVVVWREAFCGCSSLREIYLGDNVEALGYAAFEGCTALGKVRIPAGMKMTSGNAFDDNNHIELTGPGSDRGIIVCDDYDDTPIAYYYPGLKKLVFAEGLDTLPSAFRWSCADVEVLDLPESLKYYDWCDFADARLNPLRQIITDRDALAAEIALLLDLECVDRNGQPFTYQVPEKEGEWIVEQDDTYGGVSIMGCRGRIGHTGSADYTTVVIPDEVHGKPVTSIGPGAFLGYDKADAFYFPDSVKRIESMAFADSAYYGKLFMRLPKDVSIAEDAFEETGYFTRERSMAVQEETEEANVMEKATAGEGFVSEYAIAAADDPTIGTGTKGRRDLTPNIWQYLDRLSREERVRELSHSFAAAGGIDGAGWASIEIELDGEGTRFRISYIGRSPVDFKSFAAGIEDGGNEGFGWTSEPGWYPWQIQRRGGIFYVSAPNIQKSFFISREEFLHAIKDLTGEW